MVQDFLTCYKKKSVLLLNITNGFLIIENCKLNTGGPLNPGLPRTPWTPAAPLKQEMLYKSYLLTVKSNYDNEEILQIIIVTTCTDFKLNS